MIKILKQQATVANDVPQPDLTGSQRIASEPDLTESHHMDVPDQPVEMEIDISTQNNMS